MVLRELGDLAAPVSCAGCGLRGLALCPGCRAALRRLGRGVVAQARPGAAPPGMPLVWALTPYEQVVRRVIVAHKDGGRAALLPEIARLWRVALAGALVADPGLRRAAVACRLVVVPVPSSAASVRARGRDPWREVVAGALRDEPRVPVSRPLVVRRRVADQAGLDVTARAANLAGAMAPRSRIDVRRCVCVVADDVVTTGATVTEAARVLRAAGADEVRAVVIAATPRRPT